MPDRPSRAREYFDRFLGAADRAAHVVGYCDPTEPTFEDDWIDFKELPGSDSDLKRIWGRALGGFANAGGGVLVWGVDARPKLNTDGVLVDAAQTPVPFDKPGNVKATLLRLRGDMTDPPVGGVEVEAVKVAGAAHNHALDRGQDRGCAGLHVVDSERG